tara:strand:+ start:445 stop:729 length:285 start_codon:yes stop_codon:yes gene_type:complete
MEIDFYYCNGFKDHNGDYITDSIECIWPFPTPPRVGDIISDSLICKLIGNINYYTGTGDICVVEVHWSYRENIFGKGQGKFSLYVLLGKTEEEK